MLQPSIARQLQSPEEEGATDTHPHVPSETLIVYFLFIALILGSFLRVLNKKFGISYTPCLFIIGMFVGKYGHSFGLFSIAIEQISSINPHGLLQIFLPILVFEAAFNIDWHIFKKELPQILTLAFPCVLVNALIMMLAIKLVLQYEDDYYTWVGAFMFGSIVSCTDPIAVVALLKELGASTKFNTIIEGESLINDATGMILYTLGATIYKGEYSGPMGVIGNFISLTGGGIALGLIIGIIASFFLKKIFNDEILATNITFISGFVAFFLAETVLASMGIMVSGIMTIISLGLFMSAFGKTRINAETDHALHAFWHFAVYSAETVIFFLSGVIVGYKVIADEHGYIRSIDWYKLIGMYTCMLFARAISLGVFKKWICHTGYGMSNSEFIVALYGGLRGAVGISFAMIAGSDAALDLRFREIFLFDMAGCAVLTLIINAPTAGILIDFLGILDQHQIKEKVFCDFLKYLKEESENMIQKIKLGENKKYVLAAQWDKVEDYSGVTELQDQIDLLESSIKYKNLRDIKQIQQEKKGVQMKDLGEQLLDIETDQNLLLQQEISQAALQEARNRYLMSLKGVFYECFEQNLCTGDSIITLMQGANWDADNLDQPLGSWKIIKNSFYGDSVIKKLMELRSSAVIGKFCARAVYQHFSHASDVTSAYIESTKKCEEIIQNFPLEERYKQQILRESQINRVAAQEYLHTYLEFAFPEITQLLQTKKVCYNVLENAKNLLNESLHLGQINIKEFTQVKRMIDRNILKLDLLQIEGQIATQFDEKKAMNIPFFAYMNNPKLLKKLIQQSEQKSINKDEYLIEQGGDCEKFYVILRGGGTESSSASYKEIKGIGSLISLHHLIPCFETYNSGFKVDSAILNVQEFDIQTIRRCVQKNLDLEIFVWRESIYILSKIFESTMGPLAHLDEEQLCRVITFCEYRRILPGQTIDVTNGGLFLYGLANEYQEGVYDFKQYPFLNNISETQFWTFSENEELKLKQELFEHDMVNKYPSMKKLSQMAFISPQLNSLLAQRLVAVRPSALFVFSRPNEVQEILQENKYARYSYVQQSLVQSKRISAVQSQAKQSVVYKH